MAATKVTTEDWIEELKGISVLGARGAHQGARRGVRRLGDCGRRRCSCRGRSRRRCRRRGGVGHGRRSPHRLRREEDRRDQGVVRAATGLGLKEAKALVDEAPSPVKEGIERDEAEKLKGEIEEAGGTADEVFPAPRRRRAAHPRKGLLFP